MCTARLKTARVSVATTRCDGWGRGEFVPGLMTWGRNRRGPCTVYNEVLGIQGNNQMGTTCEQTDACENITFQQLRWRTATIQNKTIC